MFSDNDAKEKNAAMPYKDNDFGLFEAIEDENVNAIKGLIRLFGHEVNCYASGGRNAMRYMLSPTPLSFALSRDNVNIAVVKLLITLGAHTKDDNAIRFAKESQLPDIREIFNLPVDVKSVITKEL